MEGTVVKRFARQILYHNAPPQSSASFEIDQILPTGLRDVWKSELTMTDDGLWLCELKAVP